MLITKGQYFKLNRYTNETVIFLIYVLCRQWRGDCNIVANTCKVPASETLGEYYYAEIKWNIGNSTLTHTTLFTVMSSSLYHLSAASNVCLDP